MKKKFTKEYLLNNRGCYKIEDIEKIPFKINKITIHKLFKYLPIKDFNWFLIKKCDLTTKEKQLFALHCAKQVLPIYEEKYPGDKRVRECIETTQLFIDGKIGVDELREKRNAAADADADAYDADADAYAAAAYAAAYAADAAADDAADAADAAAYAAAYAAAAYADADAAAKTKNQLLTADICRKYLTNDVFKLINK